MFWNAEILFKILLILALHLHVVGGDVVDPVNGVVDTEIEDNKLM